MGHVHVSFGVCLCLHTSWAVDYPVSRKKQYNSIEQRENEFYSTRTTYSSLIDTITPFIWHFKTIGKDG